MPSQHPGFEYDIFISYRQNDNRSGWVTEFVKHLNEELASTIKQPVSVYFDVNPHDGLGETHNVHKSLEGKLKCLIFIPILSQTYCDPNSFAWQHEFLAFIKASASDAVGKDVRLTNGNVAGRILPIKIHQLDPEDKELVKRELGGSLRSVEFIFRSAGVNRPLGAHEVRPQDNLNNTFYNDQINKVANAIKDVLAGIRNPVGEQPEIKTPRFKQRPPGRRRVIALSVAMILIAVLSVVGWLYLPEMEGGGFDEEYAQNSVAVLPFANMSNDPEQEYFSDGMTEQIITNLAHINSLKVIARTSVMKFKGSGKSISEIAAALNVTHILEGSIRKSGDRIRVTAQLISVDDETHLWAQDYERPLSDIFTVQDDVSQAIARSLERRLTPRDYETIKSERPSSVEAYQHYLKGYDIHFDVFFYKHLKEDFVAAENEFKAAISLDPEYGLAYAGAADLYDTYWNFLAQGKEERMEFAKLRDSCSNIAMRLSPRDPYVIAVKAYSFFDRIGRTESDLDSGFRYRRTAHEIAPNNAYICDALSTDYSGQGLYYQAMKLRERTIGLDPTYSNYYGLLAAIHLNLGEFKKAEEAMKKGLLITPDDIGTLRIWTRLQLVLGNMEEAESAIQKIKTINPESNMQHLEARLLAMKGEREKALAIERSWRIYLALGMVKEALDDLEKNPRDIHYLSLKLSPIFDPFRSEPRFAVILENARLVYEDRVRRFAESDISKEVD
jgi:TolB-like protein